MNPAATLTPTGQIAPALVPRRRSRVLGLALLLTLLAALALASLALGTRPVPLAQVWQALWQPDGGVVSDIVWQYRLPRTLLAVAVGAALGVAGVLMQALTRNPLADPGLLGVNAGAAFAVVLAMSLLGWRSHHGLALFALAGAALAAVAVQLLAGRAPPSVRKVRLLLAGTALSACLAAATGIVTLFDVQTFDAWRFWMVGALDGRGLDVLRATAPLMGLGLALGLTQARALDVLALGDELGQSLGQNVARTRLLGFVALVLLCGAATAAAGPLGFVGLLVPHALRLLVGPHWRWMLPYALLAGPLLVLAADVAGRLMARPDEVEAGIVMALVGAPVLMALIVRGGHGPGTGGRRRRGRGLRGLRSLYASRHDSPAQELP